MSADVFAFVLEADYEQCLWGRNIWSEGLGSIHTELFAMTLTMQELLSGKRCEWAFYPYGLLTMSENERDLHANSFF